LGAKKGNQKFLPDIYQISRFLREEVLKTADLNIRNNILVKEKETPCEVIATFCLVKVCLLIGRLQSWIVVMEKRELAVH